MVKNTSWSNNSVPTLATLNDAVFIYMKHHGQLKSQSAKRVLLFPLERFEKADGIAIFRI